MEFHIVHHRYQRYYAITRFYEKSLKPWTLAGISTATYVLAFIQIADCRFIVVRKSAFIFIFLVDLNVRTKYEMVRMSTMKTNNNVLCKHPPAINYLSVSACHVWNMIVVHTNKTIKLGKPYKSVWYEIILSWRSYCIYFLNWIINSQCHKKLTNKTIKLREAIEKYLWYEIILSWRSFLYLLF